MCIIVREFNEDLGRLGYDDQQRFLPFTVGDWGGETRQRLVHLNPMVMLVVERLTHVPLMF